VFGDQSLAVGDRDLVIVGVDFVESQETVTVAAVIDKRACNEGSTLVTLAR
jgi:hypothetical protein